MKKPYKLLFIFGTRPEAIKLCPLIEEFFRRRDVFETKVCVTAQHREMLDQVLTLFGIMPDYDLDIMSNDQGLLDMTGGIISGTGRVIQKENPDYVFVQGDTTTTFAASLASYYCRVRVAHVEAGLRTGDKHAPFPEEVNRRLTSVLADLHFAPTEQARLNLIAEGIDEASVFVMGNTVVDALLDTVAKLKGLDPVHFKELQGIDFDKPLVLVTCHRRESFGKGLESICLALKDVAISNPSVELVYPVHLNPNVKAPVYKMLEGVPNIKLTTPLGYAPFVYLMQRSLFILSDSGGIQEEAPVLGKPVLVMRDTTERSEALASGSARLVGSGRAGIVAEAGKLLNNREEYRKMAESPNPYGQGGACRNIADVLTKRLGGNKA